MKPLRYSRQREAILSELQSRSDHPTAEQVYHSLKIKYPDLSLGTVYRNLGVLADQGDILKLDFGDGNMHYDGNTHEHIHFICHHCHRIIDMNIDHAIYQTIENTTHTKPDHISITIEGTCSSCLKTTGTH